MIGSEFEKPFFDADDNSGKLSEGGRVSKVYLSMDDPDIALRVSELIREDGQRSRLQEGYIQVFISPKTGEVAKQYTYAELLATFEKKVYLDFRGDIGSGKHIEQQAREILEDEVLTAEFFARLLIVYVLQEGKEPRPIDPWELNFYAGRLGSKGSEFL